MEICTFVRTASFPHSDDYRNNHDEVEQIKWDAFFTRMERQRVWASGHVVQVAAWYLERDIIMISQGNNESNPCMQIYGSRNGDTVTLPPLILGNAQVSTFNRFYQLKKTLKIIVNLRNS